jgi:DNA-binding MarR family transcriptional regulator
VIDRLVHAGYVERRADPSDRRKVIVRIRPDNIEPLKATYRAMQERMVALWSTFDAKDLEVIADFLSRSTELAVECCKAISQETPPQPVRRRAARAGRRSSAET